MADKIQNIEDIINHFAISLMAQKSEKEVLWDLVKNCISKLGLEDCVIYILDEERQVLVQRAAYGAKNPYGEMIVSPIEIPVGKGVVGAVAKSGKAEIVNDTTLDNRYIKDDELRYSEIAVPIVLNSKVIGIIDSEHSSKGFYTGWHLKVFTLIANLSANKIMYVRAEKQLKEEEKQYLELKNQLSTYRLQSLQAQLNPHFVFNSLNAIQHFISAKQSDLSLKYLSFFAKFMRLSLKAIPDDDIDLSAEIDLVKYYMELEKLRFGDKFNYNIHIQPSLNLKLLRSPVILIQPFVEHVVANIVVKDLKHTEVLISISSENDYIECEIGYNGISNSIGHEREWESANNNSKPWIGIYDRIKMLNAMFRANLQIEYGEATLKMIIPIWLMAD
ncbi:histidine kinase [Fulvivirga ligni]|uniref:histidine kinase n=1 Tax=Fulvivirga ligni TaxID=2904246 RepID=UPI001F2B1294|nr:histidine kinase [Fulvivirga ligni]UII23991.1 histidine kinase [Fulvivirga ligni]